MDNWPVEDAGTRLGALLEKAASEGPQILTLGGVEAAVVVPIAEWRRLGGALPGLPARPTLKEVLLGPGPTFPDDFPGPRAKLRWRDPPDFDD